jgi:hypothetical protein
MNNTDKITNNEPATNDNMEWDDLYRVQAVLTPILKLKLKLFLAS